MEEARLGKRERARRLLLANAGALRCPVCAGKAGVSQTVDCENGHTFDIAKKGYVNFAGRALGDSKYARELFESRRYIFSRGFYEPLAEALKTLLGENDGYVLDAGCGEGYFTHTLARPGRAFFGVDLSKEAVGMATDYDSAVWLVADIARLPIASSSMDAVINILSPANYSEFGRVLKPGGKLVKVIPGPGYLRQIRESLGKNDYSNESVAAHLLKNMDTVKKLRISYSRKLDDCQARAFAAMTPMTQWAAMRADVSDISIELELYSCTFK